MRICSLLPSATEMLFALGLGDDVAGVSHECDYPPAVRNLRVLTRCAFDSARMGQAEIDDAVRSLARDGRSLYEINDEMLAAADPDLIVTQDLCHVCAITPAEVERALSGLSRKPVVISLNPALLEDVFNDMMQIADAAGVQGLPVVEKLQARVKAIAPLSFTPVKPAVGCIEWTEPLWRTGHWVPEMVQLAGGDEVLAVPGKPSRPLDWGELCEKDPEILVFMPCGCDLIRTREAFLRVRKKYPWEDLKAFRENRVYLVDANSYFSRPGPRLVEGLELLAELLHPEYFPSAAPPQSYIVLGKELIQGEQTS